jgi:hypothetical protein
VTLGAAAYLRQPIESTPPALDPATFDEPDLQGTEPLVYAALRTSALLAAQPLALQDRLARTVREERLLEPIRRDEAVRVIAALVAGGVRPIVFKGTALAYTCYGEPWQRPRLDTDLLIAPDQIGAATAAFDRLGYTRTARPSGDHVTHQCTWIRTQGAFRLAFDLHWKLADPQVFAALFTFAELERDATPVLALGPAARTLSDVDALLVACVHRVAHHYDRPILLFVYDIDRLGRRLSSAQWSEVVARARGKGICRVTARGLELARELLGTPIEPRVFDALAVRSAEPTEAYLSAGLRKVDVLRSDLSQLDWAGRLTLLREHLFPPPDYLLRSYGRTSRLLLPALYLDRIVRGAAGWFKPLR